MKILDALVRDVRFAFRLMRQAPIVSVVAILSLALGIGANVAIFNLVNALMLKALPIHDAHELVVMGQPPPQPGVQPNRSFTYPQWEYIRDHQDVFAGVVAVGSARFNLNAGGEIRPASGLYVNGNFFDTLGVRPVVGRVFSVADDKRGGGDDGPVAVLSFPFWQREYGGRSEVVGQTIQLDGHAFTIIGVTPPQFFGVTVGRTFDIAVPFGTEPIFRGAESILDHRSAWWMNVIARLAPGQTIAHANARLAAFVPGIREATMPQNWRPQDQKTYLERGYEVAPAATGLSGLRVSYRRPLLVLLGIVALVLLIACANMANLLLAQASVRQKELAVRLSLGASRWQVARQLLIESLLLSSLGAASGVVLAIWGSQALVGLISTRANLVFLDLALDWRVLGFTVGVGVLTGLLFGVAPALRATRIAPANALKDYGRGVVASSGRVGLGHGLVALQVALSFVLVFGASLFGRTLISLSSQEMGFQTERVLIANIDLRRTSLTDKQRPAMFERLRDAIAAAPGVEAAAASVVTPMSNNVWNDLISVPGYDAPERERSAHFNKVMPGYFKVMGTPLVRGRDLSLDDRLGGVKVTVVNEAFTRKFMKDQNPLGRTFTMAPGTKREAQFQIVGVVADAKYVSLREPPPPTMYVAWAQEETMNSGARISMRVSGPANAFRATALSAIRAVEPEAVVDFRTFEEDVRNAVVQERLIASLSAFFGGLALLLAAMGLYGVMSYAVTRRRNEIGIRVALGAAPGKVMRLVLGQVAMVTVIGIAIGVGASIGLGRFINTLLFEMASTDRTMVVIAAVTLSLAASIAGLIPARRAARVDPMHALRQD